MKELLENLTNNGFWPTVVIFIIGLMKSIYDKTSGQQISKISSVFVIFYINLFVYMILALIYVESVLLFNKYTLLDKTLLIAVLTIMIVSFIMEIILEWHLKYSFILFKIEDLIGWRKRLKKTHEGLLIEYKTLRDIKGSKTKNGIDKNIERQIFISNKTEYMQESFLYEDRYRRLKNLNLLFLEYIRWSIPIVIIIFDGGLTCCLGYENSTVKWIWGVSILICFVIRIIICAIQARTILPQNETELKQAFNEMKNI